MQLTAHNIDVSMNLVPHGCSHNVRYNVTIMPMNGSDWLQKPPFVLKKIASTAISVVHIISHDSAYVARSNSERLAVKFSLFQEI